MYGKSVKVRGLLLRVFQDRHGYPVHLDMSEPLLESSSWWKAQLSKADLRISTIQFVENDSAGRSWMLGKALTILLCIVRMMNSRNMAASKLIVGAYYARSPFVRWDYVWGTG